MASNSDTSQPVMYVRLGICGDNCLKIKENWTFSPLTMSDY